jgi:hypothetical protein
VNEGKNFPSFQMLSACWVIDKKRVRFAAGVKFIKTILYN